MWTTLSVKPRRKKKGFHADLLLYWGETETFESYNIRDDVMSLMNEANIRPYGGYRVQGYSISLICNKCGHKWVISEPYAFFHPMYIEKE